MATATGTFDIDITPTAPELGGAINCFNFKMAFRGGLGDTGAGVKLSAGNPQTGEAGYVEI